MHIEVVMAALREIDHSEEYEQRRRDYRADDTTPLAHLAYPIQASESNYRGHPIDCQHHYEREETV